ncbi:MAG TPA: VOC family protein [Longimicrobiales bacterium]|nr:VOC family protein [Longimicrobiales bacterium]
MAGLSRIGQVSMRARDIDRAVAFYEEVLQLPLLFRAEPSAAFFDCDGVRLMLAVPEAAEFDHPGSILYFRVDDVRSSHRELTSRGVAFRTDPHLVARLPGREIWMAFFHDSEDNTLAIVSEHAA